MKLKLVSPILMWFIVLLGALPMLIFLPHKLLYPRHVIFLVVLIFAGIYWLCFLLSAGKVHRQAARSAAGIDHVVTSGVYSRVRHPIYAADIVMSWAVFLYIPMISVLAAVIWLNAVLIFWMKLEEAALEQKFGQEYADYKAVTPMIIPKIFSKR